MSQKREPPSTPDATLVFQPMTSADIPEVLLLEQQTPGAPHWSQAQYEACTADADAPVRRNAWVVLLSGQLVGFAVTRELAVGGETECELESIAVHPAAQRRGIGAALLAHVLSQVKESPSGLLLLEVGASNLAARHLYQRAGFAEKGVRKNYYPAGVEGPAEDAILMELRFPQGSGI